MLMNLRFIDLILKMDLISQLDLIILFSLMGLSFLIFFFKYMSIKSKFKQLDIASNFTKNTTSIKDLSDKAELLANNFAGNIIAKCLQEFKFLSVAFNNEKINLTDQDWHLLESSFCQVADQEIQKENYGLWALSTIAAISPLLGLFGTVWGLIDSFLVISDQASSDLAAVGGGIAEALITTLAGVIVAITALVMYNYIVSLMEKFEFKVFKLIERSSLIIKLTIAKRRSVEHKSSRVAFDINQEIEKDRPREEQI